MTDKLEIIRPTHSHVMLLRTERRISVFEARRQALKETLRDELNRPDADLRRVLLTLVEHVV